MVKYHFIEFELFFLEEKLSNLMLINSKLKRKLIDNKSN